MKTYRCGEDVGGTCAKGLQICCGLCPQKLKCKDLCYFFEKDTYGDYRECDSLIILEEQTNIGEKDE